MEGDVAAPTKAKTSKQKCKDLAVQRTLAELERRKALGEDTESHEFDLKG